MEKDWKELYRQQKQKRNELPQTPKITPIELDDELDSNQTLPQKSQSTRPGSSLSTANFNLLNRIILIIVIAATAIQLCVWLLICIFTKELVEPWWLWTAVPGGVIVWLVRYITRTLQDHKDGAL